MRENMTMVAEALPKFAGFWQPEANGRFTMVPNQFFDEIVPNEPASVTKLVGLVIRRTLGWQEADGQRRQQAQLSYSEFRREMNMSNDAIANALQIALNKGYIVKLREGRMNTKDGTGVGAFYGLAWSQPDTAEVVNRLTEQPPTNTFSAPSQKPTLPANTATPAPTQPHTAHSGEQSVQAARSDKQCVAHSDEQSVGAGLAHSDLRRDINKESFELINKVEIKRTSEPDSTFKPIQAGLSGAEEIAPQRHGVHGAISHRGIGDSPLAEQCPTEVGLLEAAPSAEVSIDGAMSHKLPSPVLSAPSASSAVKNPLPVAPEMYQRPGSVYIQNLVRDISRDFEDADHAGPNISQALNLWAARGCDERDFTIYLYEARKRTRANLGPSQTTRPNRMPYFFKVLRDVLQPVANS